ncbi:unnamed protein product [Rodentolepis nana]|uniref:Intraflagellar transport protein 56 n=1 Tax=Rodentolepis nana TaxID=102285 RepID=A0A0R3TLA1_RODNA|nr:unnamed protein product [Rodentolepis nana]
MLLSRKRPARTQINKYSSEDLRKIQSHPTLEEFIETGDYIGAITLLEFECHSKKTEKDIDLWIGYCYFHLGDYDRAAEVYKKTISDPQLASQTRLYLACCYFFMGMYKEAQEEGNQTPQSELKTRLLFHTAYKLNDERNILIYHNRLSDALENQLSLASIHFLRGHHQEAIEIYKRIMIENRNFIALNVYIGLCYYKLDYYDVALEVLDLYLQHYPNSPMAVNLRACINYRLQNSKTAIEELKALRELFSSNLSYARDLINHNLSVFTHGEASLKVLPPLIDVLPEARLNLVIYHLRREDIGSAYELLKDIEPITPHECILKAIINTLIGQETGSIDHLKLAQQHFQSVGNSASECDTICGRQCMASYFFLLRQFENAIVYLNSIQAYFSNDDIFNLNFAQAKAEMGDYKEAQKLLLMIQSEKIRSEYVYISWLARCFIMNKESRSAWELYLKMETSVDSLNLLNLIANDCYRTSQFYIAAKAFDVLERLDSSPEYWKSKRGACIGAFRSVVANNVSKEILGEIIQILRNTNNKESDQFIRIIKKWANENSVNI